MPACHQGAHQHDDHADDGRRQEADPAASSGEVVARQFIDQVGVVLFDQVVVLVGDPAGKAVQETPRPPTSIGQQPFGYLAGTGDSELLRHLGEVLTIAPQLGRGTQLSRSHPR